MYVLASVEMQVLLQYYFKLFWEIQCLELS